MSLTDYENVQKWFAFVRSLPPRWRWILCASALLVVIGGAYFYLGPWRSLSAELAAAEMRNAELRDERDSLRSRNEELHRETLFYKGLVDPIRKKAEQLYPELEADAAINQLAQDLAAVRELATRDVYRPLEATLRKAIVADLQNLLAGDKPLIKITVTTQIGSPTRHRVAREIASIFNDAGCDSKAASPAMILSSGVLPDISIKLHPDDRELAEEVVATIGRFVNAQFSGSKNEQLARREFQITIAGDPLFYPNGVVTFR